MGKNNKLALLLIGIMILAFVLRVYKLSQYPKSLSMDEITFGYSAYSILNTGRDEYGKFLPLSFRGMGDYKPPVDVYLKLPFIKLFGLNEYSVRIPGVILGSITCGLLVLFLIELQIPVLASVAAGFWLAVSGWHIFFSRAGYESITALFFMMLGLYSFFKSKKIKRISWFSVSIVSFSLSVWSYHAERLFVPILFLYLVIYFRKLIKNLFHKPKYLIIPLFLFLLFVIPFMITTINSPGVRARAEEVWLSKEPQVSQSLHYGKYDSITQMMFENDIYIIGKNMLGQYLSYFDMKFWFWKGIGMTPEGYPDVGLLYLADLPIFFLGIFQILKLKKFQSLKTLLVFLFFSGPLPGAVARGGPSPIRILVWVPFFGIIMAGGFWFLFDRFKRNTCWFIYLLVLTLNILYFYNLYFLNFHKYYSDLWHYGYKEASQFICKNHNKYQKIILTDKYGIEIPRIKTIPHYYLLFHCMYDPGTYISNNSIYNVEIRQPQWRTDSKLKNTLLIGSPWDFPEGFSKDKILKIIYFPNGKEAFYFVETEK